MLKKIISIIFIYPMIVYSAMENQKNFKFQFSEYKRYCLEFKPTTWLERSQNRVFLSDCVDESQLKILLKTVKEKAQQQPPLPSIMATGPIIYGNVAVYFVLKDNMNKNFMERDFKISYEHNKIPNDITGFSSLVCEIPTPTILKQSEGNFSSAPSDQSLSETCDRDDNKIESSSNQSYRLSFFIGISCLGISCLYIIIGICMKSYISS